MDSLLRIFEKLVSLRARSLPCLHALQQLSQGTDYTHTLKVAEAWLEAQGKPSIQRDRDPNQVEPPPPPEPLHTLLKDSDALRQLFHTEPAFSSAPPTAVAELAAICDLVPDPIAGLSSADRPFRRASAVAMKGLPKTVGGEQAAVNELIRDGLAKLYWLDMIEPRVVGYLLKLAAAPSWKEQVRDIERCLAAMWEGRTLTWEDMSELRRPARVLVGRAQQALQAGGATTPLPLALQAFPLLAELTPDEVTLFAAVRHRREELERNLSTQFAQTTLQEKARFVAENAFPLLPRAERERVVFCLKLRVMVAHAAWESRAFAKLYALEEGWESLAEQFRANQSPLLEFETRLNQPGVASPSVERQGGTGAPTEVDRLRQIYQEDRALTALLTTQPTFGEIVRTMPEILDFFAISRALVKAPRVVVETVPQPQAVEQRQNTSVSSKERQSANIRVSIRANVPSVGDVSTDEVQVQMNLTLHDGQVTSSIVTVDLANLWASIFSHLDLYRRSFQRRMPPVHLASSASAAPPTPRTQPTLASPVNTSEGLKAVGELLYKMFFQDIWSQITASVDPQSLLRLILEFPEAGQQAVPGMPSLADLPWESLYVPDNRLFIGLINRYSIVRARGETTTPGAPSFGPELRIMAVLAQPINAPPIQIERHRETLQRLFERAKQSGVVKFMIVENPTVEMLLDSMRNFKPNVFHFYGHGVFAVEQQEGAIMLVDDTGNLNLVFAQDLRNWVKNLKTIQLALINACESATASGGDVITGIAGALSDAGVPATVATTSQVFIETAERFTSEFYRALFSAYTVEAAVTEARNVLHASRVDWAPYALFANTENLDGMRLQRVLAE